MRDDSRPEATRWGFGRLDGVARFCFGLPVTAEDNAENTVAIAAGGARALPARRALPVRIWHWFWRGEELKRAAQTLNSEQFGLLGRARLLVEVARRISEAAEPFDGGVEPILCDLYRQSIQWSLRALPPAQSSDGPSPDRWEFSEPTVADTSCGHDRFASVKAAVDELTFEGFWALAPDELGRLTRSLRSLACTLIAQSETSKRSIDAIWLQRVLRLGLIFLVFVAGSVAVSKAKAAAEDGRDIARNAPWRASSNLGIGGCHSPEQECAESPDYFFHTLEEEGSWVELDLGAVRSFKAVRLDNRRDCCVDRAVPLVVEVSTDHHHFSEVAKRGVVFSSWLAQFPAVEARWVRVRLEKKNALHLARVRVLR